MMPLDRMPSISLRIIVPADASYDSHHHWHSSDGELYASVRFDAGGYSCGHIQGLPTALRELAQTLVRCAELTEQTYPAPTPAVVEGVAD